MLEQVVKGRLGPVDVVEDGDDRGRLSRSFEQLAHRPGNLLARGRRLLLAQQLLDRRQRGRLEPELASGRELLQDLDHRPVGDPLAVRQAPPADDGGVLDGAEELGCQPRLADAGRAENREELARAVVDGLRKRLLQPAQLAVAPDERRVEPARKGGSLLAQDE